MLWIQKLDQPSSQRCCGNKSWGASVGKTSSRWPPEPLGPGKMEGAEESIRARRPKGKWVVEVGDARYKRASSSKLLGLPNGGILKGRRGGESHGPRSDAHSQLSIRFAKYIRGG